MKSWRSDSTAFIAAEQEFCAWGHDFNARGMQANNQGAVSDELPCRLLLTDWYGLFTDTSPFAKLSVGCARAHRNPSRRPKRKDRK